MRAVTTPVVDKVWVAPDTPTPDVVVVMVWEAHPLVPVKVKLPTPPWLIFVSVSVGPARSSLAIVPVALAGRPTV